MTCNCTGYWFPHRAGSKFCDEHPRGSYNQAVRQGVTDSEVLFDLLLEAPGQAAKTNQPIPF